MNRLTLPSIPLALAAGLLAAVPALASPCTDEITALEARLNEVAETAGALSTGGQAVAASRESRAMQSAGGATAPGPALPPEPQDTRATQKAAEAGGGGDRAMQAKATLNRARTLDTQGDAGGCRSAVAEARRQLGPSSP
jgi:hypothetical protein